MFEVSYCSARTCGPSMLMMSKTCLKQTCCATFSTDRTAFRPVQKLAVAAAVTSTALLHLGPGVTVFTLNCMTKNDTTGAKA